MRFLAVENFPMPSVRRLREADHDVAAVDRGVPREDGARTFAVSVPTIKRWLKQRRETGDVEPKL